MKLASSSPQKDMADYFDQPSGSNEANFDTAPAPRPGSTRDQMIAARIRAGHALVAARRAKLSGPDDPRTTDLLRRAEEAVDRASLAIVNSLGHVPTNPESRR